MKCFVSSKPVVQASEVEISSFWKYLEWQFPFKAVRNWDPKNQEFQPSFWSVKHCHFIIKRLTKFDFYVILPIFKHYRTILTDLSKPYDFEVRHENYIFKTKFVKYYICGSNLEISGWKLFFQKVWMILYIFHIYDIVSKWIFTDL